MMTKTNLNKPKNYLFIRSGGRIDVVKGAKSFKDAVLATEPNGFLKESESLEAFDDTEVDEIVRIYNIYSFFEIKQVYVIEEKIYG